MTKTDYQNYCKAYNYKTAFQSSKKKKRTQKQQKITRKTTKIIIDKN